MSGMTRTSKRRLHALGYIETGEKTEREKGEREKIKLTTGLKGRAIVIEDTLTLGNKRRKEKTHYGANEIK